MSYKHNCLKNVIIRADFLDDFIIEEEKIKDLCLPNFPIYETENVQLQRKVSIILENGTPEIRMQNERFKNHIFWNRQKTKRIVFSPKYVFIDLYEYTSFTETKLEFMKIFEEIRNAKDDVKVKRVGMRYINEIDLTQYSKLVWKKYISNVYLQSDYLLIDNPAFVRSQNIIELSYNDIRMRQLFGFLNPDFPAIIKRYIFTMDFDTYVLGETNTSEVGNYLDLFHEKIETAFESVIKDKQRDRMGIVANG